MTVYIYIHNKPLFQTLFTAPQKKQSVGKVVLTRPLATVETWRHAGGPWDQRK